MNTALMANIIGVFLYPLTYYQFSSSSKKHFLLLNFVTCILFAVSLWITAQNTAALISGIAGVTSLFQINKASLFFKIGIAVISIAVTVWLAFPVTIFAWLAIIIYAWNRFAETQDTYAMRVMFLLSPLAWMLIAYHGGNYTLIPVDAIALFLSLRWVFQHSKKIQLESEAE